MTIDFLRDTFANNVGVVVLHYYFNHANHPTPTDVLRCLLKQLVSTLEIIPVEISSLYDKYSRSGTVPSIAELKRCLISCSRQLSIYVVVDAIDECDEGHRNEVISILNDLQYSGWSVVLSSRPHLAPILNRMNASYILDVCASCSDLEAYFALRLGASKSDKLRTRCFELIPKVEGV